MNYSRLDPLPSVSEVRFRDELSTLPPKADLDKLKDTHENSMIDPFMAYLALDVYPAKLRTNLDSECSKPCTRRTDEIIYR